MPKASVSGLIDYRLADPQQFDKRPAIWQFVEPHHGIDQRILLLGRHNAARQLAKFGHDVGFARKSVFTAARRFARLPLDRAIAEVHLDTHLVPVRRAKCSDRRIVKYLDLSR
jgi:hypothetical protein